MPAQRRQAWRALLAAGACVACLLLVYRVQLLSGGHWLTGDIADARIATALQEHWYNVLRGMEVWNQPLYFYPAPDTLGYNDGYFLYGLVFSACRAVGMDPYIASEATGAIVRAVGFAGVLAFGWRVCGLPFVWGVLAAALVTVSDAMYLQGAHSQLLTSGFAPGLAAMAVAAVAALQRRDIRKAVGWSCATAALLAAWLMTAFYTVWFTALFAVLGLAAAVVIRPLAAWRTLRSCNLLWFIPAAAVLAVGLVPFLATYLPKARETGMHPLALALANAPSPLDLVHFGTGNLLFGWLDQMVTQAFRPGNRNLSEQMIGFPPILLGLALAGVVLAFTRRSRAQGGWWRPLAVAFAGSLLLCVRVGDASLWRWVFEYAPAAGAVRVVSRYVLLLDIAAALLAAHALSLLARTWSRPVLLLAAALLVAEEVTTDGSIAMDRPAELRMLAALPPPPTACRSFFIQQPRDIFDADGALSFQPLSVNVDGMLLAELVHLPTPNGHASFLPASFGLGFADGLQYARTAPVAMLAQGLERGLCGLDLVRHRWTVDAVAFPAVVLGQDVSFGIGGRGAEFALTGWSGAEPAGTWTDGPAALLGLQVKPLPGDAVLDIHASAFPGPGGPSPVDVFANGQLVAHWQPVASPQLLRAVLPHAVLAGGGALRIRLAFGRLSSPAAMGTGADERQLGLFVERMQVSEPDTTASR